MAWPKWLVDNKEEDPIIQAKPIVASIPTSQQYVMPAGNYTITPVGLDQAGHEKWSKFFLDLLASKADPQYRQFISMIDSMLGIPENVKYPSVFTGLKTMGFTKTGLLSAAQKTADMLNTDAEEFKKQMDQKHKERVEDPQALISQKQQQIQDLQKEIADLTTKMGIEDQKINNSMTGYSTYFKQAQTKVANDITSITSFIQD